MKKNGFKNVSEDKYLIIAAVAGCYLLVCLFILYMYMLHRMSVLTAGLSFLIFTGIYFPRFFIIKKVLSPDTINISDTSININGQTVDFNLIKDYGIQNEKRQAVFFMSAKAVIFNEAVFCLKLRHGGQVSFSVNGSKKISLLKEFLDELLENNIK